MKDIIERGFILGFFAAYAAFLVALAWSVVRIHRRSIKRFVFSVFGRAQRVGHVNLGNLEEQIRSSMTGGRRSLPAPVAGRE
jgi:hypothetical protein